MKHYHAVLPHAHEEERIPQKQSNTSQKSNENKTKQKGEGNIAKREQSSSVIPQVLSHCLENWRLYSSSAREKREERKREEKRREEKRKRREEKEEEREEKRREEKRREERERERQNRRNGTESLQQSKSCWWTKNITNGKVAETTRDQQAARKEMWIDPNAWKVERVLVAHRYSSRSGQLAEHATRNKSSFLELIWYGHNCARENDALLNPKAAPLQDSLSLLIHSWSDNGNSDAANHAPTMSLPSDRFAWNQHSNSQEK